MEKQTEQQTEIRFPLQPSVESELPKKQPEVVIRNELFRRPLDIDFKNQLDSVGFHSGPSSRSRPYVIVLLSWTSAVIDLLFCVAMSLIFVSIFSLITEQPIRQVILSMQLQFSQLLMVTSVVFVAFYTVITRVFLGFTLGEWACGLRLGNPKQRLLRNYSLRVILRTLVVLCTGIVLLPLISLLLGKDIAGSISGVNLVKKGL